MSRTKPVSLFTTRNLSSSKFLKISWQEFRSRGAGTESGLHNYDKNPGGCSTLCSPSGSSLSKSLLQCGFLVHFRVSAAPLFISRSPQHLCSFPNHRGTSVHFQITAAPLFISRSPNRLCCPQLQIRIFPSQKPALRSSCESPFQLRQHRSHRSLPGYVCSH